MATQKWNFDLVHSSIGFWVRHLMVSKVRGRFPRWSGSLEFDEADPANSKVSVEIDASSVDTHEPKRDDHLRSPDFLDAAKYPHITFAGTKIERISEGELKVHGDLTIHGTTKPVVLDVEYAGRTKDPWGGERIGFSAHTVIDRKEFGLTWNVLLEAGGLTVGDKITIDLEVEAVHDKAAA